MGFKSKKYKKYKKRKTKSKKYNGGAALIESNNVKESTNTETIELSIDDYTGLASIINETTTKTNVMFGHLPIQIIKLSNSYEINILNESNENCITFMIDLNRNYIYLYSYYHLIPIQNCIKIDHTWFFNTFLRSLSNSLHIKTVDLTNTSTKTFKHCQKVHNIIFAFAKGSFYQKFGFVNPDFQKYIEDNKYLTINEFITNSDRTYKNDTKDRDIEYFNTNGLNKSIQELCSMVIASCNQDELLPETKIIVNTILRCIDRYKSLAFPNDWTLTYS